MRELPAKEVVDPEFLPRRLEKKLDIGLQFWVDWIVTHPKMVVVAAHDATTDAADPLKFGECLLTVPHKLEQVFGPDDIEAAIVKGQMEDIASCELDIANAFCSRLLACKVEVLGLTVDARGSTLRHGAGDCPRDAPSPTAGIEDSVARE